MTRTRLTLLAILLIALGTRAAFLASNLHQDIRPWIWGGMAHNIVHDGRWFELNERALNLGYLHTGSGPLVEPQNDPQLKYADAHPLWTPEIEEPVGEAVVLAGLWEFTGSERLLPVQILRLLIDSLTALLVYRIALRLFQRRRAALLAATLYAIYPPIAWQPSSVLIDSWGVDFTIAVVAAYLEAVYSSHRWRWFAACGVLAGIGSYFRPGVLLLPAVLALATFTITGGRETIRRTLWIGAIAATLLIPWTIRNYDDFHRFIPTRSGFGQTLWEGLGEASNNFGAVLDDRTTDDQFHRAHPHIPLESPQFDSILMHQAIVAIEHHPSLYLKLVLRRAAVASVFSRGLEWMHRGTLSPRTYGHGVLSYVLNRPFDLIQMGLAPAVFLLALLCLCMTWRRRRQAHAILIAVALSVIVPYVPLFVQPRYVLPAAFTYLIWIGLGTDLLLERVQRARQQAIARVRVSNLPTSTSS